MEAKPEKNSLHNYQRSVSHTLEAQTEALNHVGPKMIWNVNFTSIRDTTHAVQVPALDEWDSLRLVWKRDAEILHLQCAEI